MPRCPVHEGGVGEGNKGAKAPPAGGLLRPSGAVDSPELVRGAQHVPNVPGERGRLFRGGRERVGTGPRVRHPEPEQVQVQGLKRQPSPVELRDHLVPALRERGLLRGGGLDIDTVERHGEAADLIGQAVGGRARVGGHLATGGIEMIHEIVDAVAVERGAPDRCPVRAGQYGGRREPGGRVRSRADRRLRRDIPLGSRDAAPPEYRLDVAGITPCASASRARLPNTSLMDTPSAQRRPAAL